MPSRLWIRTLLALLCLPAGRSAQAEPLPGTDALTIEGKLDEVLVAGIDKFALRELAESVERRAKLWTRDYSSPEAYATSVAANREHLRTLIGAVDPRVAPAGIEFLATTDRDSLVARAETYSVHAVRWPVLDGVTAEGLLLQPNAKPLARIVALPDADWTPEMFAGLANGVDAGAQVARRLAEQGCQVLVPLLINRDDTFSGNPAVRFTNQPHREFIYRQAFEMGRHIIGYEVQKVLAGIDQFTRLNAVEKNDVKLGVIGVGEGGLLALYSAAIDPRIDSTLVSGYFQPREGVWEEPIYRNVWSLLVEFGDAEIASLITPRTLVIEASAVPEIAGPPAPRADHAKTAAPGKISICTLVAVRKEYERAREHFAKLQVPQGLVFVASREGDGPAGSDSALLAFETGLKLDGPLKAGASKAGKEPLQDSPVGFDPLERQRRQFNELVEFTQRLLRRSAKVRDKFWSKADRSNIEAWEKSTGFYRDYIWEEMIGKLPPPTLPPNVRTRQVLDEPGYRGYEVVLDVYPDVIASGILLLPKDLGPDEKRPVVVCQHGLEGVPMDTITGEGTGFQYYSRFAHELANRGFITFSPQNLYRGQDRFRTLQRKSNPLKRSLFTYIIVQHERILDWLSTLPGVDPQRIAFYGLSYGGKTAVRVPPLVTKYCLSICSADFNEWILKNISAEDSYSYLFTPEYEMFEWNMGHVANYAELSSLMAPRPFMVERGHKDGVAPDEWVAWEYAKVRRHYAFVGLPDRTSIEFFNGPHKIQGVGTYAFLHEHLNWPKRNSSAASTADNQPAVSK